MGDFALRLVGGVEGGGHKHPSLVEKGGSDAFPGPSGAQTGPVGRSWGAAGGRENQHSRNKAKLGRRWPEVVGLLQAEHRDLSSRSPLYSLAR